LENNENRNDLNKLIEVSNEVSQDVVNLEARTKNTSKKTSLSEKIKKIPDKITKIKNEVVSRFTIRKKPIDSSAYKPDGEVFNKKFSAFSVLGTLNRNSDLFYYTKSTLHTIVKTIYTPEEIKSLIEQTNSHSLDNFIKKLEKAMQNPTKGLYINNVAKNVTKFMSDIKNERVAEYKDNNASEYLSDQLYKYDNGPKALVSIISRTYGENRYYNKVNAEINKMTPLFVKFESNKEADQKIYDVEKYIKDTYNYSFKYNTNTGVNKLTRVIKIENFEKNENKMDNCVNMLYSVAKTLKGSQNTTINLARKLLNKNENNDFLTKKGILGTYVGAKYTVVDKDQSIKKIFKAHSETISDVVSTLTTIFMARFVFDHKYFADIERDLTEQVANKMKFLSFSKDSNEDYWINQLIAERLKINIAQVCASNNITNAKQLIEIYNNNGTVILNPEKISSIDDLVFALQHSVKAHVENKELINLPENTIKAKKKLKNKKIKVTKPVFMRSNKYLDKIRKTDTYKKYYEQYLEEFKNANINKDNLHAQAELDEIKNNTDKNLQALERIAQAEGLESNTQEDIIRAAAQNDVVREVVDELESTNDEVSNEENENDESNIAATENEGNENIEPVESDINLETESNDKPEGLNEEDTENNSEENPNEEEPYTQLTIDDIEIREETTENPNEDVYQLSIFDERFQEEAKRRELEENNRLSNKNNLQDKPTLIFKTTKSIKNLTTEELKKKVVKYLTKLILGSSSKAGIVGEKLNYRILEKKTGRNVSANDSERLDDTQFKKANKIRNAKIELIVDDLAKKTVEYLNTNKENLPEDMTIAKLCLSFVKSELKYDDNKTFTMTNLKNCLAVLVTESVNPELKSLNLELYTGKKTYKNYQSEIVNLIKGDE